MTRPNATLTERFEAKVDRGPGHGPDGQCHVWTACTNQHGYGQLRPPQATLKLASHVAWFLASGEWPTCCVLHHCDNPPCVRFEHLFLGTQADNVADMNAKGRNGNLRLTDAEVVAIRSMPGEQRDIAAAFGVSQSTVWRIRQGQGRYRRWAA